MRRYLLISFLLLFAGCAFVKAQKANWEACQSDPVCVEQAKAWQDRTETASVIVASAVPVPGAAAAPKVIGYIALGLAMLIGGHAINKKKKEAPVG